MFSDAITGVEPKIAANETTIKSALDRNRLRFHSWRVGRCRWQLIPIGVDLHAFDIVMAGHDPGLSVTIVDACCAAQAALMNARNPSAASERAIGQPSQFRAAGLSVG
jgi:hypothetical protein